MAGSQPSYQPSCHPRTGWAAPLHATLSRALGHVPDVVALLQADPTAQGLTDAGMLPAAFQV